MSLYLAEVPLEGRSEAEIEAALQKIAGALGEGGELVEAQIGVEAGRAFLVAQADGADQVTAALQAAGLAASQVKEVRLVGAELDEVKGNAGATNYLVECNLPTNLSMEEYHQRKQEEYAT